MIRSKFIKRCFAGICGIALLAVASMPLAAALQAQPQPGAEQPTPDVQAKAAKLEKQYEVIIRNALKEYFPEPTFLVDTRISLNKVRYPTELKDQKTLNRPMRVDQLPGLPILPEGFTRSMEEGDTLKPSQVEVGYQIESLIATVMVDTSYSDDNINFVEQLVRTSAKVDPMRGDQVAVEETAFPASIDTEMLSQHQSPGEEQDQQRRRELRQRADSLAAAAAARQTDQAWYRQYLQEILIGLASLLLLFIIIMFWINRRTRKTLEEQIPSSDRIISSLQSEIQDLKSEAAKPPENGEPTEAEKEQYERDQTYVTTQFISHPQKVGQLLEDWIQNDDEDGVWKAAKAIKASNAKLLSTLKPVMKKQHYESLQHSIDDLESLSFEEKKDQTRELRNALEKQSADEEAADSDKTLTDDIFNFLKQLTDEQVLHLLKEETANVTAIALAQLDPERSARILKQMEEERHTEILIKMGNQNDLPIETYKQVARHLSNKALDVYNMRHVPANGVKSILNLIDRMSIEEQEEYVESIAENDIDLANKVRQYFVAFSDIPSVDNELLQAALDQLETDTIITALTDADKEIYRKILQFRPQRERRLIESELKKGRDVSEEDIERARKQVLKEIRKQKSAE